MRDALPDLAILQAELSALLRERLPDLPEGVGLYEAGLDSMGVMQLLLAIEDRYGILLPEADVSRKNFCTVESLAGLLRKRLAEKPPHE